MRQVDSGARVEGEDATAEVHERLGGTVRGWLIGQVADGRQT